VDVYPDGRAINLTEGIIRARYRDSLSRPSLLEPYQVYQFKVEVGNTGAVFKAGHQIRVEISSSNFPHWDRNTNTGHKLGEDSYVDMVVATQVIFHDFQRPSHITLPIYSKQ
jgi:putative CocE/NonD family hydrolase